MALDRATMDTHSGGCWTSFPMSHTHRGEEGVRNKVTIQGRKKLLDMGREF